MRVANRSCNPLNWNDFGGTVGGPVYLPRIYNGKNRTFFFASWDISMLHQRQNTVLTVPTAAERNGDFTGDPRFAAAARTIRESRIACMTHLPRPGQTQTAISTVHRFPRQSSPKAGWTLWLS